MAVGALLFAKIGFGRFGGWAPSVRQPWSEYSALCEYTLAMMNKIKLSGSHCRMKCSWVVIPWREGLHLRTAVKLVQVAKMFRSTIRLKCGGKIADLRSILSVIALCATMGTIIELEASGDDEQAAAQAIEQVFLSE